MKLLGIFKSKKIVFALDIGSSKIISIIANVDSEIDVISYNIHNFISNNHAVMSNGLINDIEIFKQNIAKTVYESMILADCSKGSIFTNIGGDSAYRINAVYQENINKLINQNMLLEIINKTIDIKVPEEDEVIDYEIQNYLIDGRYSRNPININCKNITVNAQIIACAKSSINNLQRAVGDYNIAKITPSSVLSSMAVLSNEEKQIGVCVIDIGAGTSDAAVYHDGKLHSMFSIALGGEDVTRDIATVLNISRNSAEDIKVNYGSCWMISKRNDIKQIPLTDYSGQAIKLTNKFLSSIINERIKEICLLIMYKLGTIGVYDIINAGIVLTGGMAQLLQIENFAQTIFRKNVRTSLPDYHGKYESLICKANCSTAFGSLCYAKMLLSNEKQSVFNKIKNLWK